MAEPLTVIAGVGTFLAGLIARPLTLYMTGSQTQIESLTERVKELENRETEHTEELEELRRQRTESDWAKRALETVIVEIRTEYGQCTEKLRVLAEENEALRLEHASLRNDNAVLRNENAELRGANIELRNENAEFRKEVSELRGENAELRKEVNELKLKLSEGNR